MNDTLLRNYWLLLITYRARVTNPIFIYNLTTQPLQFLFYMGF